MVKGLDLTTDAKYGPFLAELLNVLQKHGLVDVLGLVALEDKDVNSPPLVELEFGGSTIALAVDINPDPKDAWIHVVWQFGTKLGPSGEPIVFKKHKIAHKLQGKNHINRHLSTNQ
ncbi:hypothetical protein FPSE_10532 [Fusarium pseudograminearum CS3096]|uniref:Uncharacterized protein n=1 Tax=Fusarium pseudograminearum (strain CS3096) TaxID=1028729 RepID=K3V7V7_FUSPC|nr:hypothetical protein FPSE_10532 [Fusarium pseudograminearum CS3096]EKJ69279.1 hypothetical protein FPSE_10532 [Fusarium pseudograminearum CS3096]